MYEYFAKLFGYKIFKFSLNKNLDYNINEAEIINFVEQNKIKLLVLVNPSAPLEKKFKDESLKKLLGYCKKKYLRNIR